MMKRFTYKELTLVLGIVVALVVTRSEAQASTEAEQPAPDHLPAQAELSSEAA